LPRSRFKKLEKQRKKGRLRCKRPKSREETPKEGGGNMPEHVAALQQYATAPHKPQEADWRF
jgi:hypothetical protein